MYIMKQPSMPAPETILQLVENFEQHKRAYLSQAYNETQVRLEFIDPLFEALGWDVYNKSGTALAYKDVVHEEALKMGTASTAPDYSFRIGGTRKFFVEAKKPAINIKDAIEPAYQLRRYAWSARLPLSILTDFEEFSVYDCRLKPSLSDKPSAGRIQQLTYRDYAAQWEAIAGVFSKQAVLKGSFDQYAESVTGKHGTAEVDRAFLSEIERWRDLLARNIALRNPALSQRELNYAVQMTIDRLIFLRISEDRGIEFYGQLQALLNGSSTYARLCQLYQAADERYNSGLFHFHKEKGQAAEADSLSLTLAIDDKPIKDIIGNLYYPESPYEFSVLPANILGQVYEQFLGKVIRLTQGHHAVVEDKPEVKKAGGVYYTPSFIVDYIVKNTLGKLLEGKQPGEVGVGRGAPIRVLDMACGSGSFLLGAYQYLLDWYRDGYLASHPEQWARGKAPQLVQAAHSEWKLTTAERKRILLDHIYGVDIDAQAVEVTKLSLLLKVLEGESQETVGKQLSMFHARALPDLGQNIKCGNSLIGPDFYEGKQASFLDQEEQYRINAFDWQREFGNVFDSAEGFDVVIGNPPYGADLLKQEDAYLNNKFITFSGTKDVFTCFIENGFNNLKTSGISSYIVPSSWIGGPQYKQLRSLFLDYQIESLILLPFDIFKDAYIDTLIYVASKIKRKSTHSVSTYTYPKREKLYKISIDNGQYNHVVQEKWIKNEDNKFILDTKIVNLLNHLTDTCSSTFGSIASMKRGVLFDKSILMDDCTTENYYQYFEGDVYRYHINLIANYWVEFGDKMKERPKEFSWFEGERILLRRLVNRRQRLMAALTDKTLITNKNLYSIKTSDFDYRFLLGILNSKLISFLYINQVTQATKDDFPQVTIKDILSLPFTSTNLENQNKMIVLVNKILTLNNILAECKTPDEKTILRRQIDENDRQIDALVYEVYGLTDEEIRLVEGNSAI